jgi:hypothetical protein
MLQIVPEVLSLIPLKTGFMRNWEEMTNHMNSVNNAAVPFDSDNELINSLVHDTYKIPRLLFLAHGVWFQNRVSHPDSKHLHDLFEFEKEARKYYREMTEIWQEFRPEQIAHIIFATGCRWAVPDTNARVPGTDLTWSSLIEKSLIFPYGEAEYLFPYHLVWSYANYPPTQLRTIKALRRTVNRACQALVKNLKIKHLFLRYSDIGVSDAHPLGMLFEKLLTASFAVKYYLCRITDGEIDVPFDKLYASEYPSTLNATGGTSPDKSSSPASDAGTSPDQSSSPDSDAGTSPDQSSSSASDAVTHFDEAAIRFSNAEGSQSDNPLSDSDPLRFLAQSGEALDSSDDDSSDEMTSRTFDFSGGISNPDAEATVESSPLPHAVTRNGRSRLALHDLILFSREGPAPVQVKASFKVPTPKKIDDQLKKYRPSPKRPPPTQVDLLIWISLGDINELRRQQYRGRVVFLNGSGVCNGMSLDMLRCAKMVKKSDNDSS